MTHASYSLYPGRSLSLARLLRVPLAPGSSLSHSGRCCPFPGRPPCQAVSSRPGGISASHVYL